jgi:hypothetical protein
MQISQGRSVIHRRWDDSSREVLDKRGDETKTAKELILLVGETLFLLNLNGIKSKRYRLDYKFGGENIKEVCYNTICVFSTSLNITGVLNQSSDSGSPNRPDHGTTGKW